jgi:hypothetical protein
MHCAAGVVGDIGLVVRHPTMHDVGNIEVLPATRWLNTRRIGNTIMTSYAEAL